ncbi:MAG: SPFH domain-containing protein [Muribaculaceae bacterium]|nr:SPFH domain-containing protein [Muribaculaceae bacterium]
MTAKETQFSGMCVSGFTMIGAILVALAAGVALLLTETVWMVPGVALMVVAVFCLGGLFQLEPNESLVLLFFGKYRGTVRKTGMYWVNPFLTKRKMSLRVNNLDIAPIKVNDRIGNPVLIGMVLVWKVSDTYRATFDIDALGMDRAMALRNFVNIQGDAALREVAGHYAYDNDDKSDELTLRSGGDAINELLETKINERLSIAGITVVEARINYIAYAPEIAAVMLRRQQATAIISAREKIVEGAVSMVDMALNSLEERNLVKLDNDRRATIIGNLLMVLCADDSPQTVIPTQSQS